MESCPVCGYNLTVEDEDDRQEWNRIYYSCPKCENEFTRKITYKCQSSMVQSDEWEHTDTEIELLQEAYENKVKTA